MLLDGELARIELEGESPIADALVRKDAREEATDIERGDLHEVNWTAISYLRISLK